MWVVSFVRPWDHLSLSKDVICIPSVGELISSAEGEHLPSYDGTSYAMMGNISSRPMMVDFYFSSSDANPVSIDMLVSKQLGSISSGGSMGKV